MLGRHGDHYIMSSTGNIDIDQIRRDDNFDFNELISQSEDMDNIGSTNMLKE